GSRPRRLPESYQKSAYLADRVEEIAVVRDDQQRPGVAAERLLHEPPQLLLLDEPTDHLDLPSLANPQAGGRPERRRAPAGGPRLRARRRVAAEQEAAQDHAAGGLRRRRSAATAVQWWPRTQWRVIFSATNSRERRTCS